MDEVKARKIDYCEFIIMTSRMSIHSVKAKMDVLERVLTAAESALYHKNDPRFEQEFEIMDKLSLQFIDLINRSEDETY